MTIKVSSNPEWNLERRESSGLLVWQRDQSKVRFRFEVDVLEYEKESDESNSIERETHAKIASTALVCATCLFAFVATLCLPWYIVDAI